MLNNATLTEIGKGLEQAESVLLFPHIHPDGDSIGASIALCGILRRMGKTAWVLIENRLSDYIAFLENGMCTVRRDVISDPDVCICIDCCEESRFPGRLDAWNKGKKKMAIDHHRIGECGWDMYYIDPEAAAVSELIFVMAREMDWELTREDAAALYTGIASDTGSFQYSNTTKETHRIAADLMEYDIDINTINVNLFQNIDRRMVAVNAHILEKMELLEDGKIAMSCLSEEEREACGARMQDTETAINSLRDIAGVEIAAFLKEDNGRTRVSMRAKSNGNVAEVARAFGGGGHVKAAGCTLEKPLDEAYRLLRDALVAQVREEDR